MNDVVPFHDGLPALALQAHRDDFDELEDTWQRVDAKAQGAATIAGVFLAAVLAFVRELDALNYFNKWLLTGGIVLLVASIAAAV